VLPGAYPHSPSSRFYRNTGNGALELDAVNTGVTASA
jgi:hypothetical protein